MALKFSTGLRNQLWDTGCLKAILEAGDGGCINVYAAPSAPATADDAVTGTLLWTITKGGAATGTAGSTLEFEASAVDGVLSKAADVWAGVVATTGTAKYYRHVATGDDGTLSTTQPRIQGTVGIAGADMNLSSISLTSGATRTIDFASIAMPTF